jgi:hypothetical protein
MRLLLWLACGAALAAGQTRTLRLGYTHAGTAAAEQFALDGLKLEGAWPGNPARPVDDTNLGKYLFEVRDVATNRLLYSRGFCSIYGEWETTGEAQRQARAFRESLRFPAPAAPVQVIVKRRDRRNLFREVWTLKVDPADPAIDKSAVEGKAWAVMENGPPESKVDLLLIGDGYTAAEMEKWHKDARRLAETLFAVEPFKSRRTSFNVWALDLPAAESGVSRPSEGVWRRSPVRASYDAFGSERYVLTFDDDRLREAAAAAPYDFIEIVVNGRKYGGGGIHNLYATVSSDNLWTPYVFVHEFGHHFAGLADEYYTSDVAYTSSPERPEPWEPNVTSDPKSPKWKDLIAPGTPLPTPWPKAEFEAMQKRTQAERRKIRAENRPEQEMEALFKTELERSAALLSKAPGVGAFEGALYEDKGYYRSQADCIMFTRSQQFCAACRRAIERVIELYTGK